MGRVRADGLHGLQVKALHVHQRAEAARVEHVHKIAGDAAGGEGTLNLLLHHHVHQELGRCQGRAARAGLEGEAVLQQTRVSDHIHRTLGHHQTHGIAGDLGGAGHDALGVADGGHLHHVINVNLRDRPAQQRIGHQVVGDHDDLLGVHRVREGVAQASAGGGAELAGAIAHGIGCGCGDEGHVDGRVAQGDVPGTAAVGAEVHRLVHQALGDASAQSGGHVIRIDLAHHAAFDVLLQRGCVHVEDGACVQRQLPDAEVRDLLHHHVQRVVAVAQVMVEGHGHAALQSGELDGLPEGLDQLRAHCASLLPMPSSSAMAMVCCARATMGASIILPRSATAPLPCSLPMRMASMTS